MPGALFSHLRGRTRTQRQCHGVFRTTSGSDFQLQHRLLDLVAALATGLLAVSVVAVGLALLAHAGQARSRRRHMIQNGGTVPVGK
jgi:ABC-type phosphonate transport system ATPase subunit